MAPFAWILALALGCRALPRSSHEPIPAEDAVLRPVQTRALDVGTQELTFPNGFRVVARHEKTGPLLAIVLRIHTGSAADPPGKEGLAHLVEHLTFLSNLDGSGRLGELQENRGAVSNAYTTRDATFFVTLVQRSGNNARLELAHMEARRLASPVHEIDDATWNVEVDVVENELRERREQHGAGVLPAIYASLFPSGHPYARPIGGTPASLRRITRADVAEFTRLHYRPENASLVVIGDLGGDALGQIVRRALAPALRLPGTRTPLRPPLASSPAIAMGPSLARTSAPQPTPSLLLGWVLPHSGGEQRFANGLAARLVQLLLWRKAVEDDDVIGVSCGVTPDLLAALLTCEARLVDGRHVEGTRQALMAAIAEKVPHEVVTLLAAGHVAAMVFGLEDFFHQALDLSAKVQSGEPTFALPARDDLVDEALGLLERRVTPALRSCARDPPISARCSRPVPVRPPPCCPAIRPRSSSR